MPDYEHLTSLQLTEIRETWLRQCGPCDFGLVEYGCTCPSGDYRPVMSRLLHAFEALQRENTELRTASMHRLIGLVPSGELRSLLAEWVAEEQRRANAKEGAVTGG